MAHGLAPLACLALAACAGAVRGTACPSPELTVANASTVAIEQLHLAPAGAQEGEERLGPRPLDPGEARGFPLPRPATATRLRVVWVDGRAAEIGGLDACATPRITVGDGILQPGAAR